MTNPTQAYISIAGPALNQAMANTKLPNTSHNHPCVTCGKPTRSHYVEDKGWQCHVCWTEERENDG